MCNMALVHDGNSKIPVATFGVGGVYGYNALTDVLEWSKKGKLSWMEHGMNAQGITTDGNGHLCV